MTKTVAVVGGGWAGIAAAVTAIQRGQRVSLIEMAGHLGGRARSVGASSSSSPAAATAANGEDQRLLDNGQHILIGAYTKSLALMKTIGVDPEQALLRMPLRLRYPDHEGLSLPPGAPLASFAGGVLAHRKWPLAARLRLLARASVWLLRRFKCKPSLSVSELCAALPKIVREELIEPLCVAALNTPAKRASAQVFLRVLHDALFSGRGGSDLLLPRLGLSALLAEPAHAWLRQQGCHVRLGTRAGELIQQQPGGWLLDSQFFDTVILACPAGEAARLCQPFAPEWSATAQTLGFEPIITVYLQSAGSSLPAPMVTLRDGPQAPAQFVFDLGQTGREAGLFAFVVSGAAPWVERGLDQTGEAVLAQARRELSWSKPPQILRVLAEKRATFACTPGLKRPPMLIRPGLLAAGDFVDGPYPATLEGAVRSGAAAADAVISTGGD